MAEGYKDWAAGDILTAADLEDYTVKQSVMRFADASARTSALSGVLAEGMMSYLKDTDSVEVYDGSSWAAVAGGKILQVVSTSKTDTFSTSSTSFVDVTGLSVTITPTSATSKVFLTLTFGTADVAGTYEWHAQVERDGTPIGVGDSAGSRVPSGISILPAAANRAQSASWSFLDSPASTSALVYQTQARVGVTGTILINQGGSDTDASRTGRSISTLTAFEVSA